MAVCSRDSKQQRQRTWIVLSRYVINVEALHAGRPNDLRIRGSPCAEKPPSRRPAVCGISLSRARTWAARPQLGQGIGDIKRLGTFRLKIGTN